MAALRLDLDSVRAGARRLIIACGILLAVTLCMFGDVLLSGEHHILSKDGEDLSRILLYYQQFGLDELRKGNLPLWNPHLFSGSPYLGAFQPALLYPLNWLHLAFPLATGINVGIALHCFMAGLWTYLWTSHRKLHLAACIFAGVMFMLCGAHFLQIYRGHLPNLRTIVWVPLILLAVDGLLETSSLGWLLLGSAAVALQILAGHIQYVFYGAVITAIYAFIGWFTSRRNSRAACALLALYPAGASLAAIQLLPGIQAASESLRADFPYEIARTFAFPPENLMTLVLPGILGDMVTMPYWGRWTLSEMSLYIGAAGFLLTVCGIVHGAKTQKRFALTMALIALILSFGYYTPLFRLLYDYAPRSRRSSW